MEHVTTSDIARRMCEALDRYGWIQGTLGDEKRGYCVNGSFLVVARDAGLMREDGTIDAELLPEPYRSYWRQLNRVSLLEHGTAAWSFNDRATTTLEDVKLLIKRAGEE